MDDPNFHQTAIVMIEHNGEGAMGLVINRPLEMRIDEAWSQISQTPCVHEQRLYQGGPCPGPLMVMHTDAMLADRELLPGLFFSSESQQVETLMQTAVDKVRFIVGYAGWGPGQLENELEWGVWRACRGEVGEVFEDPQHVWLRLLKKADPTEAALIRQPALRPSDPSLN